MSVSVGPESIFAKILERYAAQNAWEAGAPTKFVAARLAAFLSSENIRPKGGEVSDADATRWTAIVLAGFAPEWSGRLAVPVRQLLKASGTKPLSVCRDTFRGTGVDGICRRQELARARGRSSGTHCIDCPYWTAFDSAEHRNFLRAEWKTSTAELENNWDVYLPEDFRQLRQWLAEERL